MLSRHGGLTVISGHRELPRMRGLTMLAVSKSLDSVRDIVSFIKKSGK